MFGKDKPAVTPAVVSGTTLIAAGTEIHGDIKFAGNLEIEGKVQGDIVAAEGGTAIVRVLENGVVEGDLKVQSVIVNGTVKGNVFASDHIELAAKAKVTGDVHYSLIEMVKGAQVNGSLVYSANTRTAQVTPIQDKAQGKSTTDGK